MKDKIDKSLKQLIGLKLTRTTRAAAMECLKFGVLIVPDKKGNDINVGEFGIHLQCSWRFTKNNDILVGDADLFEQPDETADYDENFNWDIQGGNLRDVKLQFLLSSNNLVVISVNADELGGFEIIFENDIKLTVFPNSSNSSEYNEHWRLMNNKSKNKSHFVV